MKSAGVIVEDNERKLILCNSIFCDIFGIPVLPIKMIGSSCFKSAEFVKHLFIDGDKFVYDIENILSKKETVIGEKLYMKDGRILIRDYFPIFSGEDYIGHCWHYYIYEHKVNKFILLLKRIFNIK